MTRHRKFLPTKFKGPQLEADFLRRQRLITGLEMALLKPMTLVQAPAGYGKSSVVGDFLQQWGGRYCWLNVGREDDDARPFMGAVLEVLYPGWAQTPQQVPEGLLTTVMAEVMDGEEALVLVLDDYHYIKDKAIHRLIERLIEARLEGCHLIIISRTVPPLPLARWRVHQLLHEVKARDLCFGEDEVRQFTQGQVDLDVTRLTRESGGWIVGVKLRQLLGTEAVAATNDYLWQEVLAHLPSDWQTFMLPLAAVDGFNAALAEAVTGRSDARQLIEMLRRSGLFLAAMVGLQGWFQFHDLFLEMLRRQAGGNRVAHEAASLWYEGEGYIEAAVQQAINADNWPRTLNLMETYGQQVAERGDLSLLLRWVAVLPAGFLAARPKLCLKLALPFVVVGNIVQAARYLTLARDALVADEQATELSAEVEALYAVTRLLQGDVAGTAVILERVWSQLASHSPYRPIALMTQGLVSFVGMDLETAQRWMQQAYQSALFLENRPTLIMSQGHYGDLAVMGGNLMLAQEIWQGHVTDNLTEVQSPVGARAYQGMMLVHWLRGDYRLALMMSQRCIALAAAYGLVNFTLPAWLIAARAYQLVGDEASSEQAWQEASSLHQQFPNVPGVHYTNHLLRYHIIAEAWSKAEAVAAFSPLNGDSPEVLLWLKLEEALALSWLWLRTERVDEALLLLARLETLATQAKHQLALSEVWLLQAMAQAQGGQRYGERLQRALDLCQVIGNRVVFLEKGEWLARLLRAQGRGGWARSLLAVMGETAVEEVVLLDPLTRREQELLQLIAEGLSNQAIADQLVLSLSTVKWHVNNLYSKLGVRRRTEALVKARQLGLIA